MAILTDEQLEVAAKKYCELAGIDPNKMVAAPSPVDSRGYTCDVYMQHQQWKAVAEMIRNHNLIDESIRYAAVAELET